MPVPPFDRKSSHATPDALDAPPEWTWPPPCASACTVWVLYDAACPLCRGAAAWLQRRDSRNLLVILPLQTPGLLHRLGIPHTDALTQLHVIDPYGRRHQGADGLALALAQCPGFAWVRWIWSMPWVRPVARRLYRFIAKRRRRDVCDSDACRIP